MSIVDVGRSCPDFMGSYFGSQLCEAEKHAYLFDVIYLKFHTLIQENHFECAYIFPYFQFGTHEFISPN